MSAGPISLLAPWLGGAGTTGGVMNGGVKSLFAFWSGGAGVGGGAVAPSTPSTAAGRSRRRKSYVVEIDGEDFIVSSEAEAQELLTKATEQAEELARVTVARATKATHRPARKIAADVRKALVLPDVVAPPEFAGIAQSVLARIQEVYDSAARTVEIELALRKIQAQHDDDEETILLLL